MTRPPTEARAAPARSTRQRSRACFLSCGRPDPNASETDQQIGQVNDHDELRHDPLMAVLVASSRRGARIVRWWRVLRSGGSDRA
jgi:hypothetical protein